MADRYARPAVPLPSESAGAFVDRVARAHGGRAALVFEDHAISYHDLANRILGAKHALRRAGLDVGSRLGVSLPNTPQHVIWTLAALDLGIVVVPIIDSAPAAEFQSKAAMAQVAAIVTDAGSAARRRTELEGGHEPSILIADDIAPPTDPAWSWQPTSNSLAAMPFSSGTTGKPKPILLSHRNILASRLLFAQAIGIGAGAVLVHFLPLAHVYGWMALTAALAAGATVILHQRYDFDRIAGDVERHGATAICAVSQAVIDIERCNPTQLRRLRSLRWVNTGSAPLAPAIIRAAAARAGFPITTGYGLTEAAPVAHSPVDRPELIDVETVGFAAADTRLQVIDPDDPSRPLPAGGSGELVVAGPQVALGYLDADGSIDRGVYLADGAFRTGDMVQFDALGRLRIVGRIKNVIKYNGYSVAPAELEAILGTHPNVRDCVVLGEADPVAGEIPTAFVVARRQPPPDADELIAYVRERVAPQRRVRKVVFVERIPRSSAGKVLARELLAGT